MVDPGGDLPRRLEAAGVPLDSISLVVFTHIHPDHIGWATQRVNGQPKPTFPRARYLAHQADWDAWQSPEVTQVFGGFDEFIRPLADAGVLDLTSGEKSLNEELSTIHTPGHTPGSCCLLRESSRLMLTGDTILKNITPNPILNPDPLNPDRRFPSLGEYLVSLARIRSLAPTLLKTSHGEEVTDYEENFNRLVRHVRERQAKVISLVPRNGITAWEMAGLLFPGVKDINQFLAVSEAVANLDLAVSA